MQRGQALVQRRHLGALGGQRRHCGQQQGESHQLLLHRACPFAEGALEFADFLATLLQPGIGHGFFAARARQVGIDRSAQGEPGRELAITTVGRRGLRLCQGRARRIQQLGCVLVRIGLVRAIDRLLRGGEFRGGRDLGMQWRGERRHQGESANGHTQGSAELCEATMHWSAVA